MRTIVCLQCGQSVSFPGNRPRSFCSRMCYFQWRAEHRTVQCVTCGKPFQRGERSNRYCSHDCYAKAHRGPQHSRFTGYVTKAGEYLRYGPGHPSHPGWYVHEVVWWTANPVCVCADCGGTVEHVHHADHNPLNNSLSNLIGLCARCHVCRHRMVRKDLA